MAPDAVDPKAILSPEAKSRFYFKIQDRLKELDSIQLSILVWGPGKAHKYFYKRAQIREALEKMGHYAVFSEDEDICDLLADIAKISQRYAEFLQAISADFIIVLMESEGASGEVHDFGRYKSLAEKMLVLAPERSREAYIGQGILSEVQKHGVVIYYSQEELDACRVVARCREEVFRICVEQFGKKLDETL